MLNVAIHRLDSLSTNSFIWVQPANNVHQLVAALSTLIRQKHQALLNFEKLKLLWILYSADHGSMFYHY